MTAQATGPLQRANSTERSQLAVEIRGLSKSFGRTKALDGLDLAVAPGDITGFLGPNGAGKSTTIRVLLGLLRADGGTVRLLGRDPWRDAVALHRRIAYVPGDVTLWPNLTGLQAIDFLARLRGNGVDTRRRDELIERFELDPHKRARTYSKRNRQKVASSALFLVIAAVMVFSAFDHRFGWSAVPTVVTLVGDALVVIGLGIGSLVVLQNSYAAANIKVEAEQKVISTGLYRLVRHPMYFGSLIFMVGIPLALDSYWGLFGIIPVVIVFAFRILDEEKMLEEELDGYIDYTREVHYRLVPHVW